MMKGVCVNVYIIGVSMDGVWECMWMRCVCSMCERVWVYLHCVCGVWV